MTEHTDPGDETRGALIADLAEYGRLFNQAVAQLGRASGNLAEAIGRAKADGMTDGHALLELAHISDPARELARKIVRDTPPAVSPLACAGGPWASKLPAMCQPLPQRARLGERQPWRCPSTPRPPLAHPGRAPSQAAPGRPIARPVVEGRGEHPARAPSDHLGGIPAHAPGGWR